MEKYIFSQAKEAGLRKYIHEYDGKIYPSPEIEEGEPMELVDYYNEDTFWQELVYRFAGRDFINDHGQEVIEKMSLEERIKKDHPYMEKYWDEIENYGIKRLQIMKEDK